MIKFEQCINVISTEILMFRTPFFSFNSYLLLLFIQFKSQKNKKQGTCLKKKKTNVWKSLPQIKMCMWQLHDQWDISNGFAVQFLTLEFKPSFTKARGHAVNYHIHFSSLFTVCPFTRGLSYQSCKTKLKKFHEFVVHIACISGQPD